MATITDSKRPSGANKSDAVDEAKGGGMKKMLLIVIAGVVLLAAGAAGTYFLFLKEPGPAPAPEPGAMVQMEPMTLSLADRHFLKVQIAVQLVSTIEDPTTFETVKASQRIIDTFSNLAVDELTSNAARKDLTAQLLKGLQADYPEEVYDVYLTQFVIQ